MRRSFSRNAGRVVWVLPLVFLVSLPVLGQRSAEQKSAAGHEWRSYGADLASTRYSPLDQINASNFNNLEVAWRFKTDNLGPRVEYNLQSTPLVVNGVLYSTAGTRRSVVALDAATGELKWVYAFDGGKRAQTAPRTLSGRGLSYWTDGKQERIIFVSPGYVMHALDAKTGQPIRSFGKDGSVDLRQELDQKIDIETADIGLHATPLIANDVVVIGAAHTAGTAPKSMRNVKGHVRGYDVRTGKRLWIFHTIPSPGEFGNETWLNDSWSYTGNTGVWGQMSADEELGMVYIPIEAPTNDLYGGHRPGANLFSSSIVALNTKTGKRVWHFQFIHHDIWDWDTPCAPILTDLTVDGKLIKAVAQPTKQGWVYVFDRATGQPVWPIEERPVPQGDVPGEWYSPTQPFPTKPPAYERQGVTLDDLIDFTPELKAEAVKLVARYKLGPIYTPPSVSKWEGPRATLGLPTLTGGANWQGGALDPETNVFYIFTNNQMGLYGLIPGDPARTDMRYVSGRAPDPSAAPPAGRGGSGSSEGGSAPPSGAAAGAPRGQGAAPAAPAAGAAGGRGAAGGGDGGMGEGGGAGLTVRGLPLVKPPYGRLSAINLNKGEMVWQIAHGETPDNIRNNPALKGVNIPRTGRQGRIGTLVTKALVIAGEGGVFTTPAGQRGAMLRAYNKATGDEVGAVFMPAPQSGSPMTYMLNDQQYIVVAISGAGYSGELLAFRLPRQAEAPAAR
jgi:quinoprotein glucose dehydrogenase